MKKAIPLLLLLALACAPLPGCGAKQTAAPAVAADAPAVEAETPAAPAETPPPAKEEEPPAPAAEPEEKPVEEPEPAPAKNDGAAEPAQTTEPEEAPTAANEAPAQAEGEQPPAEEPPQAEASGGERNDAFFDRSVFIGDSIMEGVRQYVAQERKTRTTLGGAKFLTSIAGIALADLVGDRDLGIYYSYKGKEQPLSDILAQMDVERVFLLIGLNDLAGYADAEVGTVIDRYGRLIDSLRAQIPGVDIIVLTNPPKVSSSWLPDYTTNRSFGNALINAFDEALIDLCGAKGVAYIDTHAKLMNAKGVLPDEWCRDGYIHLNNEGSAVVVEALYAYAENR